MTNYYRYFYDHHMGVNAPGTPAQKFDDRNGGTVTGTGMNAVLEVGNARIQYDANSNRIVTESTGAGNPY